jgi:hypothetical protein
LRCRWLATHFPSRGSSAQLFGTWHSACRWQATGPASLPVCYGGIRHFAILATSPSLPCAKSQVAWIVHHACLVLPLTHSRRWHASVQARRWRADGNVAPDFPQRESLYRILYRRKRI